MKFCASLSVSLLLLVPAVVSAAPFAYPPEIYAPQWPGPFPYQRDLQWDFTLDPTVSPPAGHYNDPAYSVHYDGRIDPLLYQHDSVRFEGAVEWLPQLGGIGIDNSAGTAFLEGFAVFHIHNLTTTMPTKYLWAEIGSQQPMPFQDLVVPDIMTSLNHTIDWWPSLIYDETAGNEVLELDWWSIQPCPEMEELVLWIRAPVGQTVYVESLHVAVETIPEPCVLAIMAVGAVVLRRRCQR